jgi:hypothetical protein
VTISKINYVIKCLLFITHIFLYFPFMTCGSLKSFLLIVLHTSRSGSVDSISSWSSISPFGDRLRLRAISYASIVLIFGADDRV